MQVVDVHGGKVQKVEQACGNILMLHRPALLHSDNCYTSEKL